MKNTVLFGLIISLLCAPCLAQSDSEQIELDSLFSINNTLWFIIGGDDAGLGFANNKAYICCLSSGECWEVSDSSILDLGFISLFGWENSMVANNGLANPLLGIGTFCTIRGFYSFVCWPIVKIEDPWTPE